MKTLRNQLQRYYPYCPHCGQQLSRKKLNGTSELVCEMCKDVFWLNSKPTASVCILNKDQELLLTRRAISPFKGMWDLPGGFLLLGEDPEKGARREIREELGIALPKLTFLGFKMDTWAGIPPQATLNFYYLAKLQKKVTLSAQDDINGFTWVTLQHVKTKSVAFSCNGRMIEELKRKLL